MSLDVLKVACFLLLDEVDEESEKTLTQREMKQGKERRKMGARE